MNYTVLWTPTAEQDLAAIWMDAEDRRVITSAAHTVDVLLHEDAHLRGESRYGNLRIMFVAPLGVHFEALQDDRMVYVLTVWQTG